MPAMKFVKSIHPKNLLRTLKSSTNRHISKSEPSSFTSSTSSSSATTPTSVLHPPTRSRSSSDLSEVFKLIDRDNDGKITKLELGAVLRRIGVDPPTEDELTTMISEIDLDGDGCISLEEFAAIKSAFAPAEGMEELRETFAVFDADHDGRISAEELLSVFSAIGDERCTLDECRRMIESVDVNGDGFVCFEDFARMMDHQQLRC